jgi:cell division septum initiation protein DivIVA
MTLVEVIAKLDEYAAGDEYQQVSEEAVRYLKENELLKEKIENLKSKVQYWKLREK